MGVGNKPFLDIKPSDAAINDRAIDYIMKGRGEPVYHEIIIRITYYRTTYNLITKFFFNFFLKKQQMILLVDFTSIMLSLLLQGPGREHPLPSHCLTTQTRLNELQ